MLWLLLVASMWSWWGITSTAQGVADVDSDAWYRAAFRHMCQKLNIKDLKGLVTQIWNLAINVSEFSLINFWLNSGVVFLCSCVTSRLNRNWLGFERLIAQLNLYIWKHPKRKKKTCRRRVKFLVHLIICYCPVPTSENYAVHDVFVDRAWTKIC